jgi:hypothetical protein
LSPRFSNEVKEFWISAAHSNELKLEVFDHDKVGADDFLGERSIELSAIFTDAHWSQPYGPSQWNLRDPHKRVDPKHRDAQLKHFRKKGLGLIELKLEFLPGVRPAQPGPTSSTRSVYNTLGTGDMFRPPGERANVAPI